MVQSFHRNPPVNALRCNILPRPSSCLAVYPTRLRRVREIVSNRPMRQLAYLSSRRNSTEASSSTRGISTSIQQGTIARSFDETDHHKSKLIAPTLNSKAQRCTRASTTKSKMSSRASCERRLIRSVWTSFGRVSRTQRYLEIGVRLSASSSLSTTSSMSCSSQFLTVNFLYSSPNKNIHTSIFAHVQCSL